MSNSLQIRRIAIVGGGTAGWMAASILARALPGTGTVITVIESPDIGTVGVGEATIPPIMDLLRFLNVNEGDFVRHTQSTYKLGIKFTDWLRIGESYWHPFGTFGSMINLRPFFHAWHKARADVSRAPVQRFQLVRHPGGCAQVPVSGPCASQDPAAGLRYALHFDATLVAKYLRSYAERVGIMGIGRLWARGEPAASSMGGSFPTAARYGRLLHRLQRLSRGLDRGDHGHRLSRLERHAAV